MKKTLCILISFVLLLPFAVSCGNKNETAGFIEGFDFIVKFEDVEIKATKINASPEKGNAAIYTRDYILDGEHSVVLGEEQKGRVAFSIRRNDKNGNVDFEVVKRYEENVSEAIIPVNGFVITIPASQMVASEVKEGTKVSVTGYDSVVKTVERLDLATFAPNYNTSTSTRRINFLNPVNDFEEEKIYFINSDFEKEKSIGIDNIAVTLKKRSGLNYDVVSVSELDNVKKTVGDEAVLIFTGDYNISYAKHYFGETKKVTVSMLKKANGFSDIPAVNTKNGVIRFDETAFNIKTIEKDGAYVFDCNFSSAITPATDKKRVDVVIAEGYVVKVGSEGERSLIPGGNGFVITFVGEDSVNRASAFSVGKTVESCLIDFVDLPAQYVEINGIFFEITHVDKFRGQEGMSVLYTSDYGKSTNTNMYGSEIVIKDGKVKSVHFSEGNAEIPDDGYVLSIHNDHLSHTDILDINVGDDVKISLDGPAYGVSELTYNTINQDRGEDFLVLYRNKVSTGTNGYGYEIAVDKNGNAVADGYSGNIKIPEGGFVLSGHGINKTALEAAYEVGERIFIDEPTNGITIIRTPDLKVKAAQQSLSTVSDLLDNAKAAYLNIDYKSANDQIVNLSSMIKDAENAFEQYDFEKAFSYAQSVVTTCNNLKYAMIESKGVQNRAVWYRSTEKSDAEVEATIKKIKSLNVNSLYLETWYEGYCIGNKVEIEGINVTRDTDFDVLESFIRIGHENGIEVHAWVHNFFVGFYYKDGRNYHNPVFAEERFKDKYLLDRGGNENFYYTANGNYWFFLNPNDRECRDLILNVYEELITNYDLDGLHLDYIRYPELNMVDGGPYDFGYNQDIIDGFAKKTGIKTDPRKLVEGSADHQKWVQYRCDIITSFVGEVYDLVNKLDKDLWLSGATYPDIALFKQTIFQDVVTFAEKGYFDELYSMSYGVDNAYVLETVNGYLEVTKDRMFYTAGLAAFLETTKENFAYQLTEVDIAGADGVAVFALANIGPDSYQYEIINGAFKAPSVQVNRYSQTTSAQMDYICQKIDNISFICTILDDEDFAFIKNECAEIKDFSEKLDFENASNAQKISWGREALKKIASAKTSIKSRCGDNEETQAILVEFENLEYWLNISIKRDSK